MSPERIKQLVDRFLAWSVPPSECADPCASMPNYQYPRSGTCFFSADGARQMIEHLLSDDESAALRRALADSQAQAAAMREALEKARAVMAQKRSCPDPDCRMSANFVTALSFVENALAASPSALAEQREKERRVIEALRWALPYAESEVKRRAFANVSSAIELARKITEAKEALAALEEKPR